MIRRSLFAALALLLLTGAGSSAFASSPADLGAGRHGLCVMGGDTPSGPQDGICVWIPTH